MRKIEEVESTEKKISVQFVKSFGDIQLQTQGAFFNFTIQFMEELMGHGHVLVDWPTFEENLLMRKDDGWKNFLVLMLEFWK